MKHEMRPHYDIDYSTAVRGKYAEQLLKESGRKIAVLEPDVAKAFPSSNAVNEALRSLMKAHKSTRARRPRKTA
jgi:hypothetical protein